MEKEKLIQHFRGDYRPFYNKYLANTKPLNGDEIQALCPFHEDKNPSLSINTNKGTYFCHACGKKGDFIHFYGKINGFDTHQNFGKILSGIASDFGIQDNVKQRLAKTYNYLDAAGKLLFQLCRLEPKSFRQRRPNGKNGWVWNLKSIEPVLYRLPEVLKAKEILICEGEKDADNLNKLGFTATTVPMGAGKWRDSYRKPLAGKDIVLIPDNDQSGREGMAKIAAGLNGSSKSLKFLQLPGLPSKGDVTNFISKYENPEDAAERLSILIENCEIYTPPKKATLEDAVLEISDFNNLKITKRRAYMAPWLKESAIVLISGWRGTGKTFFALGLLDAVTRGDSFGPWDCEMSVPCLFLDGEMPPADIQERSDLLCLGRERKQPLFIYSDAHANTLGLPRANLTADKWRRTIKRILITRKIKIFVIDNIASVAGGLDENSRQDWDPVNQWLLELRFAGITTILLHHTGKGGAQRGTSAREDNLDCSIILKTPPQYTPEDGARFICNFSKARVASSSLSLIADMEFKLELNDNGVAVWTSSGVKRKMRNEILTMLDEGVKQIDIASALEITRGQVSKVRTKAIKDGFLTPKNKFTQSGLLNVST